MMQKYETIDAHTATWNEISAMMERSEFIGRDVFEEFDMLKDQIYPTNTVNI